MLLILDIFLIEMGLEHPTQKLLKFFSTYAGAYTVFCCLISVVQPIAGFSSLNVQLRVTLLDLILGARLLRERWGDEEKRLSHSCRRLSEPKLFRNL